jgi:arginyl-tRNA synthetase
MILIDYLSDKVGGAFAQLGGDKNFGRVQFSDRPDLAQFQCNGAMAAAKALGKNPRDIAQMVCDILASDVELININIAGPGFINMSVTDDVLARFTCNAFADLRFGVPHFADTDRAVVVDYGGPNVAKAMHVGHLRSSVIGESVCRILRFAGFNVLGDIHLGDWGTHIGMVIVEMKRRYPTLVYFDENFVGEYPAESPITMADLEEIYPAASAACKADEALMTQAHAATVDLQKKRRGYIALWRHIMNISIASMKKNFAAMNVYFDLWKGESDVQDIIPVMVDDLRAKDFAVEDQGAVVIPVKQDTDTKEYPPLILYKRDGATMYGTTDLATIVDRVTHYNPQRMVYVVDQRQHLHFDQVFRAARMTKIVKDDVELIHAGFGTMNGTDGKPFKTRAGGVMKLEDLFEMGRAKALEKLHEAELDKDVDAAELQDIAHKVAIAAIKFADLQNNRIADYVFDLDRLTRFEGKTGPYILYQAVRIKSLIKKAAAQGDAPATMWQVTDKDRALHLLLNRFPQIVSIAAKNYTPHVLCDHAYNLAQEFSAFYSNTHILSESDEAQRRGWIGVCQATYNQLEKTLDLLGLEIPARM